MKYSSRMWWGISAVFFGVAVDQIVKWIVRHLDAPIDYGILSIEKFHNYYIAFSIPLPGLFVAIFALIFLTWVIYCKRKIYFHDTSYFWICVILIYSGAFGNILDRIFFGYVIDYIRIGWFPVFNIADMYISIAALCAIVFSKKIFIEEKEFVDSTGSLL